jgi:hypothetical protein
MTVPTKYGYSMVVTQMQTVMHTCQRSIPEMSAAMSIHEKLSPVWQWTARTPHQFGTMRNQ